jgi:hypothetical protein
MIRNVAIAHVPLDPRATDIRKGIQKMPSQGGIPFIVSTLANAL